MSNSNSTHTSNLIDIPDISIPTKILNINKTYTIRKVNDISLPTPNEYTEALYLKKEELEDDESNIQQFKEKKNRNRQLLFTLYDDKKEVFAFEYQPLNQLNFKNCYPGAKLLIKNQVEMSINVLFLKSPNVVPLGGQRIDNN